MKSNNIILKIKMLYLKVIEPQYGTLQHKKALLNLCNYVLYHKDKIYNLSINTRSKILNNMTLREFIYRLKLYTFNFRDYKINMNHNKNITIEQMQELMHIEQSIISIVRKL